MLIANKNKLKEKLTFQEAENFAKNQHSGSELVTEEKDGTFSVYDLGTDPESKAITGKDFTDGTADLNTNVKDKFSASSIGRFSRCITIRRALRLPTPGKPDRALTAFSMVFEEKFTVAKLHK